MEESYPIKAKNYDVCRNGCMMFLKSSTLTKCRYCQAPRFTTRKRQSNGTTRQQQPCATVKQLSLSDQLALLIHNKTSRKNLLHRTKHQPVQGQYSDIYDGNAFNNLKNKGLFTNSLDIALALYTDGFTMF